MPAHRVIDTGFWLTGERFRLGIKPGGTVNLVDGFKPARKYKALSRGFGECFFPFIVPVLHKKCGEVHFLAK